MRGFFAIVLSVCVILVALSLSSEAARRTAAPGCPGGVCGQQTQQVVEPAPLPDQPLGYVVALPRIATPRRVTVDVATSPPAACQPAAPKTCAGVAVEVQATAGVVRHREVTRVHTEAYRPLRVAVAVAARPMGVAVRIAAGPVKLVRAVAGHDRRVARREARRSGE